MFLQHLAKGQRLPNHLDPIVAIKSQQRQQFANQRRTFIPIPSASSRCVFGVGLESTSLTLPLTANYCCAGPDDRHPRLRPFHHRGTPGFGLQLIGHSVHPIPSPF
ncbi:hypothetical protein [Sodalis sp.]|uniref:hypothetical protein n=1 Tax=Sodalis sp. (in: enterobacteria) TaxID=1898979 RepID=UPI003872C7A8